MAVFNSGPRSPFPMRKVNFVTHASRVMSWPSMRPSFCKRSPVAYEDRSTAPPACDENGDIMLNCRKANQKSNPRLNMNVSKHFNRNAVTRHLPSTWLDTKQLTVRRHCDVITTSTPCCTASSKNDTNLHVRRATRNNNHDQQQKKEQKKNQI
jgi:hypothetical protein